MGAGATYTLEFTSSYHVVDHPYFGLADRRDGWGEGFVRARLNEGLRDGGDGYRDTKAALWNIPLNFFDAVKADVAQGHVHALVSAANLSPSWGSAVAATRGVLDGGEAGWSPCDGADVTATWLQHDDTRATDLDANAATLRWLWTEGVATFAGEAVLEGGTQGTTALAGLGGHVALSLAPRAALSPVLKAEYFRFSGDDPGTATNEAYVPWFFRWNDWSQY